MDILQDGPLVLLSGDQLLCKHSGKRTNWKYFTGLCAFLHPSFNFLVAFQLSLATGGQKCGTRPVASSSTHDFLLLFVKGKFPQEFTFPYRTLRTRPSLLTLENPFSFFEELLILLISSNMTSHTLGWLSLKCKCSFY